MMRSRTVLVFSCIALSMLLSSTVAAETGETALIPGGENGVPSTKGGFAGRCQIGPGLASTLLIPYFEVDLADPAGVTTLFSVNNGLANETLTRVVFWTDWGIPTLAFDIYLAGFDVQTINVRDVFAGYVPVTGIGADLSGWDYCMTWPPVYPSPALTAGEAEQLKTAHTGQAGHIDGLCYGADHGDEVARGFVTVDVVDECSDVEGFDPIFTPVNISYPYFADGGDPSGIGIVDNRLWGDVVYVDMNQNSAQGTEPVALWADPAEFTGSGVYTFYGRHSAYDGRDDRVPLPYRWDQRFLNGGAFSGGADLIVFQQPHFTVSSPISCLDTPAWWPMETLAASLDEQADNLLSYPVTHFPLLTQRVPISDIGPPYAFGWIQLDSQNRQMWVQPSLSGLGRFSAGFNGFPVAFLCDEVPPTE